MIGGTTGAVVTGVIMIFEMTQSISIIPPLMAACVVSTLVATFLQRKSIYSLKLTRRGVDLSKQGYGAVRGDGGTSRIVMSRPGPAIHAAWLSTRSSR